MKPIKTSGSGIVHYREYPIAYNTNIKMGAAVTLTGGLVTLAAADQTGAILGIAAENHGGSPDALNPRADKTAMLVADNPAMIIEHKAIEFLATGGTTTTVKLAYYSGADHDMQYGFVKLVAKGASSTNTDPVGTMYAISDSAYSANVLTLTIPTAGGAVTAGDTFVLYPPIGGGIKGLLNEGRTAIVTSSSTTNVAALPFKIIAHDYDRETFQMIPTLAVLGNED